MFDGRSIHLICYSKFHTCYDQAVITNAALRLSGTVPACAIKKGAVKRINGLTLLIKTSQYCTNYVLIIPMITNIQI